MCRLRMLIQVNWKQILVSGRQRIFEQGLELFPSGITNTINAEYSHMNRVQCNAFLKKVMDRNHKQEAEQH